MHFKKYIFFRWGQTPLSEAVLFKHTKIASILKRHERMMAMKNGKNVDDSGEVLWRTLVEGKMMKPTKPKPAFKVTHMLKIR